MLIEYDFVLMSLLIFMPVAFALVLVFFPRGTEEWMRWWALFGAAVTLILSMYVFIDFYQMLGSHGWDQEGRLNRAGLLARRAEKAERRVAADQPPENLDWVARRPWVPPLNIDYYVGVDGVSMPLVLLTTLLSFVGLVASWTLDRAVKGYLILFLALETGLLGTFLALDLVLFYVFLEGCLLPLSFLVGFWGGPNRGRAATKLVLSSAVGSGLILIGVVGCYQTDVQDFVPRTGPGARATFDIPALHRVGAAAGLRLRGADPADVLKRGDGPELNADDLRAAVGRLDQAFFSRWFQLTLFLLFAVGFGLKLAVFPVHAWAPDALVEAPTAVSMLLAGVVLKVGGYGLLRIAYPICPWAAEALSGWVAGLAAVTILYAALAAAAQTDLKRLAAYGTISATGYVLLGISAWAPAERAQYGSWGMTGAVYQMLAHGVIAGGLFFLIGAAEARAGHRDLTRHPGLLGPMPVFGGLSLVVFFAALGLPTLGGFVGEFFVILAAWNANPVSAVVAALTTVLTTGYVLWTAQRVLLGSPGSAALGPAAGGYPDLTLRELVCLAPLVILAVLLGVLPNLVLSWMEPSARGLAETLAGMK